jgi:hypothetical protein
MDILIAYHTNCSSVPRFASISCFLTHFRDCSHIDRRGQSPDWTGTEESREPDLTHDRATTVTTNTSLDRQDSYQNFSEIALPTNV